MKFPRILSCLLLLAASAALAEQMPARDMPPPPRFSVDIAAMNHLLADDLAQRSGRKPQEVAAMLRNARPPEVAEQLGLDREAMHAAMKSAHESLVQKALAAGLIDKDDVQRIQQEEAARKQRRDNDRPEGRNGNERGRPAGASQSGGPGEGW